MLRAAMTSIRSRLKKAMIRIVREKKSIQGDLCIAAIRFAPTSSCFLQPFLIRKSVSQYTTISRRFMLGLRIYRPISWQLRKETTEFAPQIYATWVCFIYIHHISEMATINIQIFIGKVLQNKQSCVEMVWWSDKSCAEGSHSTFGASTWFSTILSQ